MKLIKQVIDYGGAFVLVSGTSALQVLLYEILFEDATQFHHSNWKLPYELEKNLIISQTCPIKKPLLNKEYENF